MISPAPAEIDLLTFVLAIYHEAGHAVAGVLLGVEFANVNTNQVNPLNHKQSDFYLKRYSEECFLEKRIIVLYAGCVSNQIRLQDKNNWVGFGVPGAGRESDADQLADHLAALGGQEDDWQKFIAETEELLRLNWPAVERVARNLLLKGTLTYGEVRKLVDPTGLINS